MLRDYDESKAGARADPSDSCTEAPMLAVMAVRWPGETPAHCGLRL